MGILRQCLIYSNGGIGFEQIRALLRGLPSVQPTWITNLDDHEVFEHLTPNTDVIHLHVPYTYVPVGSDLRSFYRADCKLRKLRKTHPHYFTVNLDRIQSQARALIEFLIPDFEAAALDAYLDSVQAPEPSLSTVTDPTHRLYEDRRLIIYHEEALSPAARAATHLGNEDPPVVPLPADVLPKSPGETCVLVQAVPSREDLRKFLGHTPPGQMPTVLYVIFAQFCEIRVYLADPEFSQLCRDHRIKLWHVSEWQDRLSEELSYPRCCLGTCSHFIGEEGNSIIIGLKHHLANHTRMLKGFADDCGQRLLVYYKSAEFQKRLEAIAAGAAPRILIEQACSSVAVKQFSRNLASAYQKLGYETFIHENCRADRRDYGVASLMETLRFKPDYLITSPNNLLRHVFLPMAIKVPVLVPLQDLSPHQEFPAIARDHPLNPLDSVLIMQERFRAEFTEAGIADRQVHFDFLPTEAPLGSLEVSERYDVGLVKTMSGFSSLSSIMSRTERFSDGETKAITGAERWILDRIKRAMPIDLYTCQGLLQNKCWHDPLLQYCHEQMCLYYARALATMKISLALSGANWDKFADLKSYARGHIHGRDAYQRSFLECRINLSLNPWNEYHPRVLDGGRLGAFFLVYKVDETVRWQALPRDLEAGVHYDTFTDAKDLKEKVAYYLAHPEKRREIGSNLRAKVESEYTYERMATKLIDRFRDQLTAEGVLASSS